MKLWQTLLLLLAAIIGAGTLGYNIGSDSAKEQYSEASQLAIPAVIDYVVDMCENYPPETESAREFLKSYGTLLFVQIVWLETDPDSYFDYLDKFGDPTEALRMPP